MRRILMIDDDALLAAPLATYFRRFDYELDSAVRPSEGLAKLRAAGLRRRHPRRDAARDGRLRAVPHDPARVGHPHRDAHRARRRDGPHRRPGDRRRRLHPQAVRAARAAHPHPDHPAPRPRAAAPLPQSRLVFDGLEIDLERRQVLRQGEPVELTGTEFELLAMLARAPQKVFHRDEILNRLRGQDADLYTRAVDILVSRLRKKLEPLDCIKTLRNAGYAFAGGHA
jgi:two-component system OmpR family response regulator